MIDLDAQPATPPHREIYSVSRLNLEARGLLESGFPLLWIEGEISNLARPSSGHLYFTLKDPQAQVRCAMFRQRNSLLRFAPENGQQVLVRARVSLYEGRGEFQLIIEQMEEAGDGALRRAFEELKQKLAAQGLFDADHKQPIPPLPRRIGVITSPTGAAIRDILSVLRRRFPALPVLIYPVAVQGQGAGQQIAEALALADRRQDCDVLILARGGGSLEDLWAFNEEVVARAIHACRLPVVSGVGHEIDVTIADFVADQRAATPSAAAELISPDQHKWLARLAELEQRLYSLWRNRWGQRQQQVHWLWQRLQPQHPGQRLRQQAQRLDELEQRLHQALRHSLRHRQSALAELSARLRQHLPLRRLESHISRHANLTQRLYAAWRLQLERRRQRIELLMRALDAVSPLATLTRGYAIVTRSDDGRVLRAATDAAVGDTVDARLAAGRLRCKVIASDT